MKTKLAMVFFISIMFYGGDCRTDIQKEWDVKCKQYIAAMKQMHVGQEMPAILKISSNLKSEDETVQKWVVGIYNYDVHTSQFLVTVRNKDNVIILIENTDMR